MQPLGWVSIAACVGHLALAILVLLRGAGSPLALPLVVLSADLFTWNSAALAYEISGQRAWHWLDIATSPFSPPLALHTILLFVGRARELRWLLLGAYVPFTVLSATALFGPFAAWATHWTESAGWAWMFLVSEAGTMGAALALLAAHLWRGATDADERARTRLMLAAVVIGGISGATELWDDLGVAIPPIGNVGTLACTLLLALVALRYRLFGDDLGAGVAAVAVVLALLGVLGYVAVFRALAANSAMLVLATTTVTVVLLGTMREVSSSIAAHRARIEQLALLGRMSAQMAHDLKNPLAALKGAFQYVELELERGEPLAAQREFLGVMGVQIERLERVIAGYQRLARVDPVRERMDVNALVRRVLGSQGLGPRSGIEVTSELAQNLPACFADPDLLAGALENVVRNACEAMPEGGRLTVRTEPEAELGQVLIHVEDTGQGMDSRVRERVFDDFYTTKATGSGLGLAFVRRVVEAHGGAVTLDSAVGRGTVVTLRLPAC